MPYRAFLFLFLLCAGFTGAAQNHKVQGRVSTAQGDPIPFATLRVREARKGTISSEDGTYALELPSGRYQFVISRIGFKTLQLSVLLTDSVQQHIVLEEEAQSMSEVIVKARARDRSEEIMRQVVRKKDSIGSAAGAYSYTMYVKAVLLDSNKRSKEEIGNSKPANITMAEIVSRVDVSGKEIKEQRLAVRGSHHNKRLFYLSATEGSFSLSNNLIHVPALSPTPFVSPVSKGGLIAYQFKTIKIKRTGKYRVYTFSVKPLGVTNATVSGELVVSDSSWTVLHARFRFPDYHLQEYDFFEVEQDFDFIRGMAWLPIRQQFTYHTKGTRKIYSGQTTVHYSDYALRKSFGKKHFGVEVSATVREAYERDTMYWTTMRPETLSGRERALVQHEDRMRVRALSEQYLDSLDRKINRITWQKLLLFGQSLQDHKKERTWHFSPVSSLYKPFAFGGGRLHGSAYYLKTFPSRKTLEVSTDLSYGFRNNDVNGNIDIYRRYNPFNRGFYTFSAGRDFAFINEGDAWINLIQRNNFYLNQFLSAGYGMEIANGLVVSTKMEMAFRQSVEGYQTGKLADSLLVEILNDNQAVAFQPYRALYGKWKVQYTPAQKYRREPKEKIILGSRWPTFYVQWEKGIPHTFGSAVDFDYLEFGMEQQLKLGLAGMSRYTIKSGEFLTRKDLKFIDYKFQRRGDPFLFMNPNRSFQALDSTFPVFDRFVEAHLFHEFNGLFLNKIPLFKKLQLREVGGIGFLLAPERKLQYAEMYVGVERAFTSPLNPLDQFKLGIYMVSSASNQFREPLQFKVGFTTWDKKRNKWF